jgi:hypothetical protein
MSLESTHVGCYGSGVACARLVSGIPFAELKCQGNDCQRNEGGNRINLEPTHVGCYGSGVGCARLVSGNSFAELKCQGNVGQRNDGGTVLELAEQVRGSPGSEFRVWMFRV